MSLGKILFFFCLPALIWNAPLTSSGPIEQRLIFSPWDLLKYENLSYDSITAFIETVEYGCPSQFFDDTQIYEVLNFIISLAQNGISSWNIEAQEELQRDIEWLFSDKDEKDSTPHWSLSSWIYNEFSVVSAIFRSDEKRQVIQCKSFVSKKWDKTKKFVKKHKKPILIAAAVAVAATVVIVATGGAGAAPLAGAAVTTGAATSSSPSNNAHSHINKPGDVRVQDEEPSQEANQQDPFTNHPGNGSNVKDSPRTSLQVETIVNNHKEEVTKALQYHSEVIKETLSEELPSKALNIPQKEEPDFWQNAAQQTKGVTSSIAHDALKDTAEWAGISNETAYQYHEKIDEAFGTNFAAQYTPEALDKEPDITKGLLPPPGGSLATIAKRVAVIARSTGAVTGAAVSSILTKTSPLLPPNGSTTLSKEDIALDRMAEAGSAHDREGLTKAGRSLQKHGERPNTVFPKPSGSVSEVNACGQKVLESILNHPGKAIVMRNTSKYGIVIDVHVPEVGGARYNENGDFIGFLQPTQGMNSE